MHKRLRIAHAFQLKDTIKSFLVKSFLFSMLLTMSINHK